MMNADNFVFTATVADLCHLLRPYVLNDLPIAEKDKPTVRVAFTAIARMLQQSKHTRIPVAPTAVSAEDDEQLRQYWASRGGVIELMRKGHEKAMTDFGIMPWDSLVSMLQDLVTGCPDLDGTDAAHAAWWRGNDSAVNELCAQIHTILDGHPPSREGPLIWKVVQDRIHSAINNRRVAAYRLVWPVDMGFIRLYDAKDEAVMNAYLEMCKPHVPRVVPLYE